MRYVFRLSAAAKDKLDAVAPPQAHRRSGFIREAIVGFLCKPAQPLADRPHIRGRQADYQQVCAILNQEQVDAIKAVYPDVSVSVVIQAAVLSELRKKRVTMASLTKDKDRANGTVQIDHDDPNPRRNARNPRATRGRS